MVDLLNLCENLSIEKNTLQLLSSLPFSNHTLSCMLLHCDKESITYNEVMTALLTDDIQQKLVSSSTHSFSSTALYVTRERLEKESTSLSKSQNWSKSKEVNMKKIKCFKCGKLGHMKKYCRSKPQEKREIYISHCNHLKLLKTKVELMVNVYIDTLACTSHSCHVSDLHAW